LVVKAGAVTLSVTETGTPVAAPAGVTVTVPVSGPGVVRPDVLIETLTDPGTVAGLLGVASNQVPLGVVVTEKLTPEVPLIVKFCAGGAVPPMT